MSYVIYNKATTVLLTKNHYETERAAKAGLTREAKKQAILTSDYDIADSKTFYDTIELKETRHGIAGSTGKEFEVGVNTPWTSGPWSETYWSS